MQELLLRVEFAEGSGSDLRAEVAAEHAVGTLALALATHLGATGSGGAPTVHCDRLGGPLAPELTVLASGLVSGDVVRVAPAPADRPTLGGGPPPPPGRSPGAGPAPVGLCCDVISGAGSGTSWPIAGSEATIGRARSCDLVLDDPTVSSRHAVLSIDTAGDMTVAPAPDASNAVVLDGRVLTRPTPLAQGSVLQLGACALIVREHGRADGAERDQLGQIPFNRTPYGHPDLRSVEVRGAGRPPAPYEPRPPMLLATLLPLVGAVGLAWWLGRPEFLLFAALSPLSMLSSWWSERRRGGAGHAEQLATFERRFAAWIARYDEALADERRRRAAAAPDLADLARRAELRTPDLWPRGRRTEGFLHLRLGLGSLPARTTTPLPEDAEGDPAHRVETAIAERRELASVPITADLMTCGVLAVHGAPAEVEAMVASVMLQAAVLHSPDDLIVCGYLHRQRALRDAVIWLPHARSVGSPLTGDHLVVGVDGGRDVAAADDLLRRVLAVITDRTGAGPEGAATGPAGDGPPWPRILLLLDELVAADPALIATVLDVGPAAGVVAVWMGHQPRLVPRQANAVVVCPEVASGRRAHLWTTTDPTQQELAFDPDRLSRSAATRSARALAPVREASSASVAASIPRIAPLLETLGSPTLDVEEVLARWSRPVRDGLTAPIGVGPAGPLTVDLVAHGPHALIAGTSGAGKSELLRSVIAALIVDQPPTRLHLLFIDYKGGASSDVFRSVPHTVGHVTNLSADLAMRALVSLRAELDRRMRILEGRAKDLAELLARHPDEAPPRLVIVVDEFATLVHEIPDFVAGMVDIAQRGRSLGIHLILATQRPAGAVNGDILANTNLRIGLRMLDAGDSSSILGGTEAASIPAPLRGRAFARLGDGGLVEFQSAFAAAPWTAADGSTPVEVTGFPETGSVTCLPSAACRVGDVSDPDAGGPTHLDVVVTSVVGAAERLGLAPGRRPWLDDLPRHIDLQDVFDGAYGPVPDRVPGRDVLVGVVDEPARQVQRPDCLDLEASGGLLIFGTGGSGRTTALRTLLGSVIRDASSAAVVVHVLDFGGRALEPLRDLPHVAAVATGDDLELATRLLMHLRAEVGHRQRLLAADRAENLTAYNRMRPDTPLPRLLLALDGYEAFARTFERGDLYAWSDLLVETVLAGRAVGLHLLATADRRIGVPAALATSVGGRLILRTADADGLVDLGVPPAIAREARLGEGRALLPGGITVQIPVVGDDVSTAGQTADLEAWSRASAAGRRAGLPVLPETIRAEDLSPPSSDGPLAFVLGVADLSLRQVTCDLRLHHLAVIGPAESGRSTALHTAARALRANSADVWVLTDRHGPLARDAWDHAALGLGEQRAVVEELVGVCKQERFPPPVLVVDAVEQIGDDVGMLLEPLVREGRVRVLAGADADTLGGYVAGWAKIVQRAHRKLLLQPDDLGELGALTSARIRLRPGQEFPPGRGVFVDGRNSTLMHVARVTE